MGGTDGDVFGKERAKKKLAREKDKIDEANAKIAMQKARQDLKRAEKKRREQAREVRATRLSNFGSQGISSRGGSAAVILRRIKDSADSDIKDQRTSNQQYLNKIKGDLQNQRRLNLLTESADRKRRKNESFKGALSNPFSLLR